jgi:cytochrome P450
MGAPDVAPLAFDPFATRADPYPTYRRLRDEAPVHYSPERRVWSVTRFDDVMHVLKSPDLFSSRAMFTMTFAGGSEDIGITWDTIPFLWKLFWKLRMNPLALARARILIAEDGERHTSMRAIINRGFTPRQIADWEPRVREVAAECVAPLRRGAPFDAIADLAVPLPVTIIAEMLGVSLERRADFKRWSDSVIAMISGPEREHRFAPRNTTPLLELMVAMRDLARDRRAHPGDDLISAILAEQDGEIGLTDLEVVEFIIFLLIAGNETTTNLIGNLTHALLEHSDVLREVAADPGRIPALIEEVLRYESPIQVVFRTATEDTEIRGVRIGKGQHVAAYLGAANRDERRFPDPHRLDLDRDLSGFAAFGFGRHFCLGASLARLESRVALEALVPELLRLERVERHVAHHDSFLIRGPKRLALQRAA